MKTETKKRQRSKSFPSPDLARGSVSAKLKSCFFLLQGPRGEATPCVNFSTPEVYHKKKTNV